MSETPINNIQTLRATLFETLTALSDKEKPMEIDRAKAISEVSQTIINSVKAEIDFVKATGAKVASEFIPIEKISVPIPKISTGRSEPMPGITVHKLRG